MRKVAVTHLQRVNPTGEKTPPLLRFRVQVYDDDEPRFEHVTDVDVLVVDVEAAVVATASLPR